MSDLKNQKNQRDQSNPSTPSTPKNPSNPNSPSTPSTPSSPSAPSAPSEQKITFLPKRGHYRQLRVYQVSEMIYDITYYFTQLYMQKGDRTVDQMIQAARSGKQNIAEGNQAAATSSETEIKLTNVAKASLEELLDDYEDYLRVRNLQKWGELHPRFEKMRLYAQSDRIRKEYAAVVRRMNDEEIANLCITLIHQAIFMLYKLLETMQNRFVTEGGIKERMFQSRMNYRNYRNNRNNRNNPSNPSNPSTPSNPSNPNTPSNPSTPNTPSNPSNPNTPSTPSTPNNR